MVNVSFTSLTSPGFRVGPLRKVSKMYNLADTHLCTVLRDGVPTHPKDLYSMWRPDDFVTPVDPGTRESVVLNSS